ncbi:hypothetical protein BDK51DRAFT_44253 [Blyttiomyces helicus]|uniref:Molybdopterin synthase sulfur carrier subunit n=1 Tax=Blyttiomyces helicus TaxID=388810 RepID=A0A4P9W2H8_9FUNG|nr:hypothetical protein BDK51DRAFT_44253 [Blyttiomyces helicus]|eukprot:RKO86431.1 hypothetical protein BDK51DRAFT_44253 [Blyttiomyces helicus]
MAQSETRLATEDTAPAASGPANSFLWTITVLYFAASKDLAGTGQESLPLPNPVSVPEIVSQILSRHSALEAILDTAMVAVNLEYVDKEGSDGVLIKAGDEVALIPPVSGG